MSIFNQPLLIGVTPAIAAAVGFVGIAVFQIALAAGAPLGRAAWGGSHFGTLPVGLRVGSGVAVAVWVFAAVVVLARAGATAGRASPTRHHRPSSPCGCPMSYRGWSGGVSVFVDFARVNQSGDIARYRLLWAGRPPREVRRGSYRTCMCLLRERVPRYIVVGS